jgi:soluble lytic murein transglycosylase-like protein
MRPHSSEREKLSRPRSRGTEVTPGLKPLRVAVIALLLGSLFGCSQVSFVPGGPHAIAAAELHTLTAGASRAYGVKRGLLVAVIQTESHGDPSAISRAGAAGLMQLMPGTSAQYGVANPFDPHANIDGGTHYLRDLLHRYRGNVKLALAAYNAGPGLVDAAHGIPAIPETRWYVARVIASIH